MFSFSLLNADLNPRMLYTDTTLGTVIYKGCREGVTPLNTYIHLDAGGEGTGPSVGEEGDSVGLNLPLGGC